jgi:hypothetical protein
VGRYGRIELESSVRVIIANVRDEQNEDTPSTRRPALYGTLSHSQLVIQANQRSLI